MELVALRQVVVQALNSAKPAKAIPEVQPYNFNLVAQAFKDENPTEEALGLIEPTINEEAVKYSRVVTNRLNFLRQSLIPLMSRIADRITANFEAQALTQPEIIHVKLPSLLQHPQYMMMVSEQAAQSSDRTDVLRVDYPEMTEEEVLDFLKTGNQSVDDAIVEMVVDTHGRDWLMSVYQMYFVQKSPFAFTGRTATMELEIYAICHLITSAMLSRHWKSPVDRKPTHEYEKALAQDAQGLAFMLKNRGDILQNELVRGQVVLGYEPDIKKWLVDEDNYNAFISEGGDLDTLLYCIKHALPTYKSAMIASYQTLKEKAVLEWKKMIEDRQRNYKLIAIQAFPNIFQDELMGMLEKDIRFMTEVPKGPADPITEEDKVNIIGRANKHFVTNIQNRELDEALKITILDNILNIRGFSKFYDEVDVRSRQSDNARVEAGYCVMDEIIDAVITAGLTVPKE